MVRKKNKNIEKEENKSLHKHLHNYRVFPRLFSILYIILMFKTVYWALNIGNNISVEAAGLVGTIISAGAAWFKFYVESGPGSTKGTNL